MFHKKPVRLVRKCAICGAPTYGYTCSKCTSEADKDEKDRKKPYHPRPFRIAA